jgi:DNA gyrase/topoisomerase IV subunit A
MSLDDFFTNDEYEEPVSVAQRAEDDEVKRYFLSQLAGNEWLEFAIYTVENRAIPNVIDGLKSSQRFYLYSSLQSQGRNFEKVSGVGGVVSNFGYQHG